MQLIEPSFEIIEQSAGLEGVYKQIEKAGRVSHKSEDRITENSAPKFVERMVKSGHGATLEFGTVYLKVPKYKIYRDGAFQLNEPAPYTRNLYYKIHWNNDYLYITTNYRYIIENKLEHWLQFLCEPTEYHEKRICVKFICDRAIANEFVRHRKFSFLQESTRYCNYSKDKFNNELTFIQPCWADESQLNKVKGTIISKDDFGSLICEYYYHLSGKQEDWFKPWSITPERNFIASLQIAEQLYLELLNQGCKPQEARDVLPLALKTELYMCGFTEDWKYFFDLRCNKAAHPQARELAIPLREEFVKRGYIKDNN